MTDQRIVTGVRCGWWDSIDKVATTPTGLPICPECGSPLLETPTEAEWWAQVDAHEANGNPGYRGFVEWLRGQCHRGYASARAAYETRPTTEGEP